MKDTQYGQHEKCGLLTFDKKGYVRATVAKEQEDDEKMQDFLKLEAFSDNMRKYEKEFKGKRCFKRTKGQNPKQQGLAQMNWEAIRVGR